MSEITVPAPETNQTPDALVILTARIDEAEARYRRSERRFRVLSGTLLTALVAVASLPFAVPAAAQGYAITLKQLADKVAALETKTASMSVLTDPNTSQPTVRFSNVNVQIVSGSGATDNTINGRGNLVIGYNETGNAIAADDRSGSHNLIVGKHHNYGAFGGIVAGESNIISNRYAMAIGGGGNTANGDFSVVTGGNRNIASGNYSSVTGGYSNTASGGQSSVSGGDNNSATGAVASISGGESNVASGVSSSVSGGHDNRALAQDSSVTGGNTNAANANSSSITGGVLNETAAFASCISGGSGNSTGGGANYSSVSGGNLNFAAGINSSVSGGQGNRVSGEAASISGGLGRVAPGIYDWVAGVLFQDN